MKQLTLMLGLFLSLCVTAQKKESSASQKVTLDASKIASSNIPFSFTNTYKLNYIVASISQGSDTLVILDSCKFIKVGSNVFTNKQLKEKGFFMPIATLQKLIDGLQELPAKTANPITQYIVDLLRQEKLIN